MPRAERRRSLLPVAAALCLVALPCLAAEGRMMTGVNIAGAEFGRRGQAHGTGYIYPGDAELDHAASRGFGIVRLPFLWERLQPVPGGPLDADELALLAGTVDRARARGLAVVLDPHNYARYDGRVVGSDDFPSALFADFWRRLADAFANRPGVVFGLMNEPHDMPTRQWVAAANAAIAAIRATGARNMVLAPGNAWTGAHSWNDGPPDESNADAMQAIADPCGNTVIEFHQYLDTDSSGTHAACEAPAVADARLSKATDWLRRTGRKGFLGEFGTGSDANCLKGLEQMLRHVEANRDVWVGWAYWAAGAWWAPDYPLSVQPRDGSDRPQMDVLRRFAGGRVDPPLACTGGRPAQRAARTRP